MEGVRPAGRTSDALSHLPSTAGHLGVAKTITRIACNYYWPSMFHEIAKYVRNCPNCLAYKSAQNKPLGNLHPTALAHP